MTVADGSGSFAQSPDELFDVVDVSGVPTGAVKRRADVHRDGDWHRAIHVWLIGESDGEPWILFQRRSLAKDTWPGELDCTVGGHLGSGETFVEAYREIEEEIGIVVDPLALRRIGTRIAINDLAGAYLDRELQDIFLLPDDRPLDAYRPNPHELDGLVRIPLDPLLDVFRGDRESLVAQRLPASGRTVEPVTLTAGSFHPVVDDYFYRVAIAARNALRGDRHVAV